VKTKFNPFDTSCLCKDCYNHRLPSRFLSTMYNLGLGFQGIDRSSAIEIVMELEDTLEND